MSISYLETATFRVYITWKPHNSLGQTLLQATSLFEPRLDIPLLGAIVTLLRCSLHHGLVNIARSEVICD